MVAQRLVAFVPGFPADRNVHFVMREEASQPVSGSRWGRCTFLSRRGGICSERLMAP